jgi:hypothetical protein
MGLHRPGVREFAETEVPDWHTLFAVAFYFDKWICLCHGAESTLLWNSDLDLIEAEEPEVSGMEKEVLVKFSRSSVDSGVHPIGSRQGLLDGPGPYDGRRSGELRSHAQARCICST